jgi:hypothetical protein
MFGYLAVGLMTLFMVFAIYLRIKERDLNCNVIHYPHPIPPENLDQQAVNTPE